MDHDEVIGRLRALGSHPIDENVATRHLELAATADGGGLRRVLSIAAMCLLLVGVPAAGIIAAHAGDGDSDLGATVEQPNEATTTGVARATTSVASGSTSSIISTTTSTTSAISTLPTTMPSPSAIDALSATTNTGPTTSIAGPLDDCVGPPFLGTTSSVDPAADVDPSQRASEATTHADRSSACHDQTTSTSEPPPETPATSPASTAAGHGRDDSGTHGPPAGVPAGRPDDVPGPPAHAAEGAPHGAPAGGRDDAAEPGGGQGE